MSHVKLYLYRAGLVLWALFCVGLVGEVALRLAGQGPPNRYDRSPYIYNPDAAVAHPWSRGQENVFRIAVIGDSFAEGAGVELMDRYLTRLEYLMNLNEGVRPAEVRGFVASGTSTFQQQRLLRKALKWEPELVILGVCLNDFEDWSHGKEVTEHINAVFPRPPPQWAAGLLRRSRLLGWIYTQKEARYSAKAFLDYYDWLYREEYSGRKRFDKAIGWFVEACAKYDVRLVAVIFPLFSHDLHQDRYPFHRMHEIIRETMDRHGMRHFDLYRFYRDIDHTRLEAIPMIDPHPNEIAHRIAAESILFELLTNRVVDISYLPHHLAPQLKDKRWHDLERRMMDPLHLSEDDRDFY
jgi:hypothetical protein